MEAIGVLIRFAFGGIAQHIVSNELIYARGRTAWVDETRVVRIDADPDDLLQIELSNFPELKSPGSDVFPVTFTSDDILAMDQDPAKYRRIMKEIPPKFKLKPAKKGWGACRISAWVGVSLILPKIARVLRKRFRDLQVISHHQTAANNLPIQVVYVCSGMGGSGAFYVDGIQMGNQATCHLNCVNIALVVTPFCFELEPDYSTKLENFWATIKELLYAMEERLIDIDYIMLIEGVNSHGMMLANIGSLEAWIGNYLYQVYHSSISHRILFDRANMVDQVVAREFILGEKAPFILPGSGEISNPTQAIHDTILARLQLDALKAGFGQEGRKVAELTDQEIGELIRAFRINPAAIDSELGVERVLQEIQSRFDQLSNFRGSDTQFRSELKRVAQIADNLLRQTQRNLGSVVPATVASRVRSIQSQLEQIATTPQAGLCQTAFAASVLSECVSGHLPILLGPIQVELQGIPEKAKLDEARREASEKIGQQTLNLWEQALQMIGLGEKFDISPERSEVIQASARYYTEQMRRAKLEAILETYQLLYPSLQKINDHSTLGRDRLAEVVAEAEKTFNDWQNPRISPLSVSLYNPVSDFDRYYDQVGDLQAIANANWHAILEQLGGVWRFSQPNWQSAIAREAARRQIDRGHYADFVFRQDLWELFDEKYPTDEQKGRAMQQLELRADPLTRKVHGFDANDQMEGLQPIVNKVLIVPGNPNEVAKNQWAIMAARHIKDLSIGQVVAMEGINRAILMVEEYGVPLSGLQITREVPHRQTTMNQIVSRQLWPDPCPPPLKSLDGLSLREKIALAKLTKVLTKRGHQSVKMTNGRIPIPIASDWKKVEQVLGADRNLQSLLDDHLIKADRDVQEKARTEEGQLAIRQMLNVTLKQIDNRAKKQQSTENAAVAVKEAMTLSRLVDSRYLSSNGKEH